MSEVSLNTIRLQFKDALVGLDLVSIKERFAASASENPLFTDVHGNGVIPRSGDYVLASDIENEDQHEMLIDAFFCAGCSINERLVTYPIRKKHYEWWAKQDLLVAATYMPDATRRIIPGSRFTKAAIAKAEGGAS